MWGEIPFDRSRQIQGIAPGAFERGGTAGDEGFVVMDETVTDIEKETPGVESAAELDTSKSLLRAAVLTTRSGTREKIRKGIQVDVSCETIIEIKTVAWQDLFAVRARFALA